MIKTEIKKPRRLTREQIITKIMNANDLEKAKEIEEYFKKQINDLVDKMLKCRYCSI